MRLFFIPNNIKHIMENDIHLNDKSSLLGLIALLLVTVTIYFPALSGPFLYDDIANLGPLYANMNQGLSAIFVGESSILGRPLALLTFLVQSSAYPDHPIAFKLINLIIHCANGILVWLVVSKILELYSKQSQTNKKLVALLTTALWLIHPFFISTTMYIIQRMTLISFFFSMAAICFYLYRPMHTYHGYPKYIKDTVVLILLISAGVLAKENTVLIFPVILLLGLCDRQRIQNHSFKRWLLGFTIIPTIFVATIIFYYSSNEGYMRQGYDYTAYERLLTQLHVLFDYIRLILTLDIREYTLLYENYPIESSISSLSILYLVVLVGAISLSIYFKKTLYAIALLWFVLWHSLESSTVPLLPYFEHRNYLPAVGLILLYCHFVVHLASKLSENEAIKRVLITLPLILVCYQSYQLNKIWASEEALINHWYAHNPNSTLAQMSVYNFFVNQGNFDAAYQFTNDVNFSQSAPKLPMLLAQISVECGANIALSDAVTKAEQLSISAEHIGRDILPAHSSLYHTLLANPQNCLTIMPNIQSISENLLLHAYKKDSNKFRSTILTESAYLYLKVGDIESALKQFERAFKHGKRDVIIPLVDISINLNSRESAERWLTVLRRMENKRTPLQQSFAREIYLLEAKFTQMIQQ